MLLKNCMFFFFFFFFLKKRKLIIYKIYINFVLTFIFLSIINSNSTLDNAYFSDEMLEFYFLNKTNLNEV